MRFAITTLLIVWTTVPAANAADYYVATNGSNSNSGSLSQPFRTIQQAAAVAQAGDNVYVRGGTYRETVSVTHSGTAMAPITFQPYAGERVTITGLDPLNTNWSVSSGSIYSTSVSGGVSQLFINGRMMTEARWPNNGYSNPLRAGFSTVGSATIQQSPALSTITDPALGNPAIGYWTGAKMAIAAGSEWTITAPTNIISQTGNNLNFHTDLAHPAYTPTSGNPYFLYGTLAALDAPNEWHYDAPASRLHLQAPAGANPASQTVEIRTRQLGLDLGSQSHVHVSGFRFVAAGINVAGDHNTLDNNQILYPTPFIEGSGYHPPGGVEISGNHNTITRSEIAYTWGSGVMVKGSHNEIENNLIHDIDWSGQQGGFIKLDDQGGNTGGDNRITNNTMYNAGRDGINLVNSTANTQIQHNNIARFGYLTKDLGGIYSVSAEAPGSVIAYNRISDNRSEGLNVGIYFDYDTSGITVHHNLVTNTQLGVIVNSPGADIGVYNNTLWNIVQAMSTYGDPGTGISNVTVYNNLSNDSQWTGNDIRNNRYQTVDQFTNAPAGDFTLTANNGFFFQTGPNFRRAVDFGRIIPGITDGYAGSAPDAGAFERGAAAWSSGADWNTWLAPNEASAPLTSALFVSYGNARAKATLLAIGTDQRAFLKFDLSNLSDQPVERAVLRIYENAAQDLTNAGNLTLSRVTSAWTEGDVSFDQSKLDLTSTFYDPANVDFYTDIEVTDTILAWLANPSTNFGFSLQGTGPTKFFDGFYGIAAPTLIVTYAVPEPSILGPWGFLVVLLARARRRPMGTRRRATASNSKFHLTDPESQVLSHCKSAFTRGHSELAPSAAFPVHFEEATMRHLAQNVVVAIAIIAAITASAVQAAVVSFSSVSNIDENSTGGEIDSTNVYQFGWNGYFSASHEDGGSTVPADVTVNGRTFYNDPAQVTPSGVTLSVVGSGIFSADARVNGLLYSGTMHDLMDIATITPFAGSFTVTLNGLTPLQNYIVQFLAVDTSSSDRSLSISANAGAQTSGVFNPSAQSDPDGGKYVFATFTADATTQAFDVTGSSARAVLNGVLVLTPVPEPASMAVVLLGLPLLRRPRR